MSVNLRKQVFLKRESLDVDHEQLRLAGQMAELLEDIPPLSHTVSKVLNLLEEPDVSLTKIASGINRDPALASRILKLANSPMFYRGNGATSIPQALSLLGLGKLRAVLVAAQMESLRQKFTGPQAQELEALQELQWRNSVCTALASYYLARMARRSYADEVFLAGLLHDLGKHALLFLMPSAYLDMMEQWSPGQPVTELERTFLGFAHTLVGTFAAQKWCFPVDLCEIIRIHHHRIPRPFASLLQEKAALVQAGDLLAHALGHGHRSQDPSLEEELQDALLSFGLNSRTTAELYEEIGAAFKRERE